MAQEGLPQRIDVHVDPGPIPNPPKHVISSAKLTLNPAHRHNESGLMGTGWARELDPQLHDFHSRKLLQPGWAGEVNHAEATYIASCLVANPRLRQTWHIARFTRRRKSITGAIVKKLARWWTEMPLKDVETRLLNTADAKTRCGVRKNTLDAGHLRQPI